MTRFYCFDPDEGADDWELPRDCAGWINDDDNGLLDECECGQIKDAQYEFCDSCDNEKGEVA